MVLGMQRVVAVLVVMLMWTVLPGCSGDGGSDPTTVSQPPTQGGPSSSPPVGGNLPPQTGTFGGGQGKILFVEGTNNPISIAEFDLATRQVRTLAEIHPTPSFMIHGGVTRANDGSFAVTGHDITQPLARTTVYHFKADGTVIHEWTLPRIFFRGGALSPDAKSVALAERTVGSADRLEVLILNVQSGTFVTHDLLGPNDEPPNKTNLHASAVWTSAGELYVLSDVSLHRVDRVTGEGTLVHRVPLLRPGAPVMSSDMHTIYFDQDFNETQLGEPIPGTIWSMDVASGEVRRRITRSGVGGQYAPTLSPDGEWLLLRDANVLGGAIFGSGLSIPFNVSAVHFSESLIDTQNVDTRILDAAGKPHEANGRMVWY